MDFILGKVTQQAMNYAIRSGITITSGYAISQCSRLMKTQDAKERDQLEGLQRRLDSKIRIISPAIDMIELITARGNTSLESCVSFTKALRLDIQNLGTRLANAAADEEASKRKGSRGPSKADRDQELKLVVFEMKDLLQRLEDAVPLINLAITTSGVSLSTTLPASISPSRLLQASTFLSAGDATYATGRASSAQIGPTFTLSMYMLFHGHASQLHDEEGLRHATWQEVIHKARVRLTRTPLDRLGRFEEDQAQRLASPDQIHDDHMPAINPADEFAYQLSIVEDLDDGRVHTLEDGEPQRGPFDGVDLAGLRDIVPVHEISKVFYADTGKILNINTEGESNNPILLLKRDANAVPPRRMMHQDLIEDTTPQRPSEDARETVEQPEQAGGNHWRLPVGLDPEWIALEVYTEDAGSDSETDSLGDDKDDLTSRPASVSRNPSLDPYVTNGLSKLHLSSTQAQSRDGTPTRQLDDHMPATTSLASTSFSSFLDSAGAGVRTSLSLLEMLIRLTSLQQFQQASHLSINDELLNFFLEESSTTGAASGDSDQRKRIRMQALQRVGFDPYNESPIKRRGERQQHQGEDPSRGASRMDTPSSFHQSSISGFDSSPLAARVHSPAFDPGSPNPHRTPRSPVSSPIQRTPAWNTSQQSIDSLATQPSTTKSREAFLREENAAMRLSNSSPLAKKSSISPPAD